MNFLSFSFIIYKYILNSIIILLLSLSFLLHIKFGGKENFVGAFKMKYRV